MNVLSRPYRQTKLSFTEICDLETMSLHATPRNSQRRPLRLTVKSRVESRPVYVEMIDISEGGCKVSGSRGFANVGDRITMKVSNIYVPVGKVAWMEDRVAGISFEGEVHPAVLDHLCAAQVPDVAVEKDDQSRRL